MKENNIVVEKWRALEFLNSGREGMSENKM